jgi:hypothetical protein
MFKRIVFIFGAAFVVVGLMYFFPEVFSPSVGHERVPGLMAADAAYYYAVNVLP